MKPSPQLRRGALCCLLLAWLPAFGQRAEPVPDISLEDLVNTEVVSASRKSQSLQQVPAAVFVISQEDIARSGARNLADVLAMAPGMEVERLGNNRWAVTARGYNGRFANKLQVLKDGRSIYSPPFSSVFWEAEDMVLEDIDHIEILRGPNAALWGANSVNGTINIVTRRARDTQGGLLAVGAGSDDKANIAARYGTTLGDSGYVRFYGKDVDRRAGYYADGTRASDRSSSGMAGFRADWLLSASDRFSLSGEANRSRNDDTFNVPSPVAANYVAPLVSTTAIDGAHLQGRYEHLGDDGSGVAVQSYLSQRTLDMQHIMREERTTLDLDVQYRFAPQGGHDFMLGANYRKSTDSIDTPPGSFMRFNRRSRDLRLFGVFLNDEITVVPDRFRVTLGARIDHTNTSGVDLQPTARFLWTPNAEQTIWGAVSHAARTPSRAEEDLSFPLVVQPPSAQSGGLPVLVTLGSNSNNVQKSEKMDALELGYRQRINHASSIDATVFVHRYRDGFTVVPGAASVEVDPLTNLPYLLQTLNTTNGECSQIRGFELAATAQMSPGWRLKPAYTWTSGTASGLGDTYSNAFADNVKRMPQHQLSLRSQHDLDRAQQLDFWLKFKSKTRFQITATPVDLPATTNLDIRYAWRVSRALQLSVTGQNLLHRHVTEYIPDQLPSAPVEIGRGIHLRAEFRY